MKLLPTPWPHTHEGNAVGFFAQVSMELVHEKSWEGYKLPVLSSLNRIGEAKTIAKSVMRGVLPLKALRPVVEEASHSFCNDPVIKEIVTQKKILPENIGLLVDDKAHEIFTQCGFLLRLCKGKYRQTAEDLLVQECFGKARRSTIQLLLRNYLSHLRAQGHSRSHIEQKIRKHFFETPRLTVDRNTLRFFFREFSQEMQEYEVYGVAQFKLLEVLKGLIPLEIIEGSAGPRKLRKAFPKSSSEAYFRITFENYDHYSAIEFVGEILNIGEAMLILFPGAQLGEIPKRLCATKKGSPQCIVSDAHPTFSRRILSHSQKSAFNHMERAKRLVFHKDTSVQDIVGSSYLQAIVMAGLGDRSTAPQLKLLTLWAAFEALLPNVPDGATNRIEHFLEYIVPAVTLAYPRDCFVELSRELERLHGASYRNYLIGLPGNDTNLVDKLAAVVISGDKDQKRGLCEIFQDNPLALFRLMELESNFSDPEGFSRSILNHRQKVKWQVQRIYRERNTVMHNGQSSMFILRLLSNTYYYFAVTYSSIETIGKSYGNLPPPEALSAIRKLCQSDEKKIAEARSICKQSAIEAQSLLRQVVAGHFYSSID